MGYEGYIDFTENPLEFAGWVINHDAPDCLLDLDIKLNGAPQTVGANQQRDDLKSVLGTQGCHGFYFSIPHELSTRSIKVEVTVKDTDFHLQGSPFLLTPRSSLLRTQHMIASMLANIEDIATDDVSALPGRSGFFGVPRAIMALKANPDLLSISDGSAIQRFALPTVSASSKQLSETVDIIVPVYKGFDDTIECIDSVLDNAVVCSHELIVINDASPDEKLAKYLRQYSLQRNFTFIENDINLGFVGTVNRGMLLHPDRDVVLLNSDAVVFNDWLDRMRHSAYQAKSIGTATPFSNNAEIFSYPKFLEDSPSIDGFSWSEIDKIAAQTNPKKIVDVPTAMGFCMYIKRTCLDDVGLFDEETFGHGSFLSDKL